MAKTTRNPTVKVWRDERAKGSQGKWAVTVRLGNLATTDRCKTKAEAEALARSLRGGR